MHVNGLLGLADFSARTAAERRAFGSAVALVGCGCYCEHAGYARAADEVSRRLLGRAKDAILVVVLANQKHSG
ncbi:MAG: hypothetical protein AMJ84_09740 [Acidithiobacillales bacterium SM23_46]|nr:MAG: hypothetical protein AMS22_00290 [Thiotrichales bacterium SG8_50]KPK69359.1 MAG: hypothetical protein AMJ84_09740 [Acidithiobacillales bacterium SM23_46]